MILKQSTAVKIPFFMVDSSDSITGKTGLSPTVTLSKDGAAFGAAGGSVTEIGLGLYYLSANTTDVSTLNALALHATAPGADPWDETHQVCLDLPGATVSSVTGNVVGSVASVVGNVGGNILGTVASVVGAVGSVTGNVGGNVLGSVASVAGNIGGNVVGTVASVVGAVGSVIAAVTVGTNNDKTGYALSSAGVQAIWDALTSALTAIGSIGKLLVTNLNAAVGSIPTNPLLTTDTRLNNLDATISSRLATSGYTAPDNASIAAIKAKTDNLPAAPADETLIIAATNSILANVATVQTTATGIKAKTDNLPANPASQTNLDVAVSTRLAASDYTAPDNADILLIKGQTDQLTFTNSKVDANATVDTSGIAGAVWAEDLTGYIVPESAGELLKTAAAGGGGGGGSSNSGDVIGYVVPDRVVGYVNADATVVGAVDC